MLSSKRPKAFWDNTLCLSHAPELPATIGLCFVGIPGQDERDSGEAERSFGIGLKLLGFIPEPVFTFIPESRSGSSRNTVRLHPGNSVQHRRDPTS